MLDISYLSDEDNERPSFVIKDAEFKLFDAAFSTLKQQTGVYIDPYGTSRIYPSHQQTLIQLLSKSREGRVVEFVTFLKASSAADEVLIADGE